MSMTAPTTDAARPGTLVQGVHSKLLAEWQKALVGQEAALELLFISLLVGGHVLIEGVPGTAKTLMAKTLARLIRGSFKRIQFTPDLMPSDVIGTTVFDLQSGRFHLKQGPVFTDVLLADEINRAPAKTQSALLEAMEELQVTVDGVTYPLPRPFIVLATQNPIEYEGTFPLPEAQLDRFLMRISLGYPGRAEEIEVLNRQEQTHPLQRVQQVVDATELVQGQQAIRTVHVDRLIKEYIVSIVDATRRHEDIYLGASPRGSLALQIAAQARAAISGRDYVIPDDIKALAASTLAHRLILSPSARIRNADTRSIIGEILRTSPVPGAAPVPPRR